MTYFVAQACYRFQKRDRRHVMEPIVALGLIVVGYGGYVSVMDLAGDVSVRLRRRSGRAGERTGQRKLRLEPPVKKMAGMHI